jgi:predicted small metal-binding protein
MERVLTCDCGFEVHADDEAEFVARVRRHALKEHGMQISPDEVLRLAFRAELDEETWQWRLRDRRHEDAS